LLAPWPLEVCHELHRHRVRHVPARPFGVLWERVDSHAASRSLRWRVGRVRAGAGGLVPDGAEPARCAHRAVHLHLLRLGAAAAE
jgi:hypothetical protein